MTLGSPPRPPAALENLLVLELGARCGVSAAGSLLAQLGATVIFVEARERGDFAQPKWDDRPGYAAAKRSLAVDLALAQDLQLLRQLLAACDVVLRASDADPLAFRGTLPEVEGGDDGPVTCDITAFGGSGPLAALAATDIQIQALTGVMEATGLADQAPLPIPLPLIEQLAGVYAAAAVMAALRGDGAGPRHAQIALYDVAFSTMTSFLPAAFTGRDAQVNRVGNRHTLAAPWNVYQARDGWVLMCAGNDDQWQRICGLLGDPGRDLAQRFARMGDRVANADEIDASVQAWMSQHDVARCVSEFSALGVPCGPIAPVRAYPREANLEHRNMVHALCDPVTRQSLRVAGSPLRMSESPGRAPTHLSAPDADRAMIIDLLSQRPARTAPRTEPVRAQRDRLPLEGLRVLEIGHYTTAPAAARLLAALGAEVIKLEPPEGEAVRNWPPVKDGRGIFFTFQNANKQSLVLDLQAEEDRSSLRRLVEGCDVLVENLRPGALARKGLGPEQLLTINPRLVYCSISGFGADSIYPARPAFDTVVQAMSGLMDLIRAGEVPMKTGPSLADVTGAAFGMMAIVAALTRRDRSGRGQFIDLSMQDICAWATQPAWRGGTALDRPMLEACADGHVMRPAGADLAALARADQRCPLHAAARPTRDERLRALRQAGVQAVPVLSIQEAVATDQTRARELWCLAGDETSNGCPLIASPLRYRDTPPVALRPGPMLGRDTAALLRSLL